MDAVYRNESGQRVRLPKDPDDWCGDMSDLPLTDWELNQIADDLPTSQWQPVKVDDIPKSTLQGSWVRLGRKAWCVAVRGPIATGTGVYIAGNNYFGQSGLQFGTSSPVIEVLGTTDDGHTLCLVAAQSGAGRRAARYANNHRFHKKRG